MDYKSYNELELSDITYSQPSRKLNYYVANPDKEVVVLTNLLTCTTDLITSENRCYINLELKKRLDSQLINFFIDLDEKNICEVFKNSETWFGKKIPLDVIEDFLTSFIRRKKNKQIIKININPNILENMEYLKTGSKILPILAYNGIIINKNQFKTEWELIDFIKEEDYDDGYDLSNINEIDYSDNKNNLMSLIHNTNLESVDEENDSDDENDIDDIDEVDDVNGVDDVDDIIDEETVEEPIIEKMDHIETILEEPIKTRPVEKLQQKAHIKRKKKKIIKTYNRKIIFSE
tara:strand:+ start:534 stop:1406 length:873 start_codon:yes stop_codon:yes gene_type:complete